jgi:monothiol glutaredoxin
METPIGPASDPDEPARVRQLSAPELKAMMDAGTPLLLVDVRTETERAIAKIHGSRLLDQEYYNDLMRLDRDTTIVFQCHHGFRSQSAAEYYLRAGFRNLYNLAGGIEAWSQLVDPSVPRY